MKVGVIGAGVMGRGIAQVSAMAGFNVVLFDINPMVIKEAKEQISTNLDKAISLGKLTEESKNQTIDNLTFTNKISDVVVDLIIEAIVEKLEVKAMVMNELAEINTENTIYASNTSSIPLTQLAANFKYPSQVVGIHYFNPAHIMKLVEVISAEQTSEEVLAKAKEYVAQVGKKCIVAKDAPGFIVNRVARHFYVEGLKIAEENVANFQVIDELVQSSGFKMGPFELMDLIGIDVNYSVTCSVWEAYEKEPRFAPHSLQKKMVDEKRFGRKVKHGFYKYD